MWDDLARSSLAADGGTVLCRNCRFCTTVCPMGVRIPDAMTMINLSVGSDTPSVDASGLLRRAYARRTAGGPASACVGCGACLGRCPQGIEIVALMARAVRLFE